MSWNYGVAFGYAQAAVPSSLVVSFKVKLKGRLFKDAIAEGEFDVASIPKFGLVSAGVLLPSSCCRACMMQLLLWSCCFRSL